MYLVRRKLQHFSNFHVMSSRRISVGSPPSMGFPRCQSLCFWPHLYLNMRELQLASPGDYLINNSNIITTQMMPCFSSPVRTTQELAASLSADPIMHCRHPALGPVLSLNAQHDCALSLSFSIRETNTLLLDYWRILPRGIWSGKTAHEG